MNIFLIEKDQKGHIDWSKSARSLDNYRVVKMILESTQLMCTALNQLEGRELTPYKSTHINHPCSKWLRESYYNFHNLYIHAKSMCEEYTLRFGKVHKCEPIIEDCYSYATIYRFQALWRNRSETQPPLCMPDEFKSDDLVESYRKYYASKPRIRYAKINIPEWFLKYRGNVPFEVI